MPHMKNRNEHYDRCRAMGLKSASSTYLKDRSEQTVNWVLDMLKLSEYSYLLCYDNSHQLEAIKRLLKSYEKKETI